MASCYPVFKERQLRSAEAFPVGAGRTVLQAPRDVNPLFFGLASLLCERRKKLAVYAGFGRIAGASCGGRPAASEVAAAPVSVGREVAESSHCCGYEASGPPIRGGHRAIAAGRA